MHLPLQAEDRTPLLDEVMTGDQTLADPAPSRWVRVPRVRELDQRQMESILTRHNIGRMIYVAGGRIEVRPVHFVYSQGAILGRTSPSERFGADVHDVVFEIDEAHDLFSWRSVIVRGRLSLLRPSDSEPEDSAPLAAITALRSLVPGAFTERDPTPERAVIFHIDPVEITGREARTRYSR